jgi:hypothetical protein
VQNRRRYSSICGVAGFLGNLEQLYRQADPTVAAWEAFLVQLSAIMPKSGFKVADVVSRIRKDGDVQSVLPEDLGEFEPSGSFQIRLGKALVKRLGRRYGESGTHLVRVGTRQGAVVWAIQSTSNTPVR